MFRLAGLCARQVCARVNMFRLAGLCQGEHVQISRVVPG